jgi:hypothetical protein
MTDEAHSLPVCEKASRERPTDTAIVELLATCTHANVNDQIGHFRRWCLDCGALWQWFPVAGRTAHPLGDWRWVESMAGRMAKKLDEAARSSGSERTKEREAIVHAGTRDL